jgi:hypothetical protein
MAPIRLGIKIKIATLICNSRNFNISLSGLDKMKNPHQMIQNYGVSHDG